jgi:hypothetical protein
MSSKEALQISLEIKENVEENLEVGAPRRTDEKNTYKDASIT